MANFSEEINSKFPNDKVKAFLNIIYTANWINSKQNAFFKPFGLSPQQYNILRILRGAKLPLKVQTIKERMIERSPNVTRLMDKLIDKQLIERIACPNDRRVVHISITDQGLELLKTIDTHDDQHDFLNNLTETEGTQLSNLLDKIRSV
ncbi:MarR family winged helix-turn-helix transcriptional regulator [Winogradskyella sp.]|jgi:DNA-binding MarR family transcriptional regulator|uniref:MarR family winged helix-turn-helix transcriptional regulator n=1 Tax=Winogradskyella sp. TaxID=1883156 RepID=UPI0025F201FE|nr:MarR family transcriptional regulator [Winogradskyella sp.]MCT4629629.1 MarR family transcriptional regulator [Winogradskyella sp.]